jgi:hypothetical protein
MGGSDDPFNLIELTVEEHAEAHRILYEQYGKHEDKIAWLGLSGQLSKEEIIKQKLSLGGKNSNKVRKQRGLQPYFIENVSQKQFLKNCSKGGKVSTNKDSVWWYNGIDYKFCVEQPEGYCKSNAPNNPGKMTAGTKWWNDGVRHKRSITCPDPQWVEGRINKGNLGGLRIKNGE